jgi:DNA-directed RNA polymerase specialized sigma24 family protein
MSAVAALDIKYREPVYLLMQGYKHKEIAGILGVPIDTASTRIRQSVCKIRRKPERIYSKLNETGNIVKHYV